MSQVHVRWIFSEVFFLFELCLFGTCLFGLFSIVFNCFLFLRLFSHFRGTCKRWSIEKLLKFIKLVEKFRKMIHVKNSELIIFEKQMFIVWQMQKHHLIQLICTLCDVKSDSILLIILLLFWKFGQSVQIQTNRIHSSAWIRYRKTLEKSNNFQKILGTYQENAEGLDTCKCSSKIPTQPTYNQQCELYYLFFVCKIEEHFSSEIPNIDTLTDVVYWRDSITICQWIPSIEYYKIAK